MQSDGEIEKYLNKKCGLLGVSGKSDDMREIIKLSEEGDTRGVFAYSLYIYRLQVAIGQMAASLKGVDAIVFTATIGERSDDIRKNVVDGLEYLGFALDTEKNLEKMDDRQVNIAAAGSKPIYVIKTDESDEMIVRANELLNKK